MSQLLLRPSPRWICPMSPLLYVPNPAASLSKMNLRNVASIVCQHSCCVPLQDGSAQSRLYCMSQLLLCPSPRCICAMSPLLYVPTPAASLSKMDRSPSLNGFKMVRKQKMQIFDLEEYSSHGNYISL